MKEYNIGQNKNRPSPLRFPIDGSDLPEITPIPRRAKADRGAGPRRTLTPVVIEIFDLASRSVVTGTALAYTLALPPGPRDAAAYAAACGVVLLPVAPCCLEDHVHLGPHIALAFCVT